MQRAGEKLTQNLRKPEVQEDMGDKYIRRRIILKWILRKQGT
jgi:hypothetical protein